VYPLVGAILAGLLGIAFRRSKLSASLMFGAAVLCIVAWLSGHRADWWAVAAVGISIVLAPIAAIHFAQAFIVGRDGAPRRRPHK
jgi:cytosine/uracil/thiamine/allantoin permease